MISAVFVLAMSCAAQDPGPLDNLIAPPAAVERVTSLAPAERSWFAARPQTARPAGDASPFIIILGLPLLLLLGLIIGSL